MKRAIRLLFLVEIIILMSLGTVFAQQDLLTSVNELQSLELTDSSRPILSGNRIIITYKNDNQDNIANLGLDKQDFVAGKTSDVGVDVLELKDSVNSKELIEDIENNEIVDSVDYDGIIVADAIPNDTYFSNQNYYSQINDQDSWDLGSNHLVKVAIVDTGLDTTHEDLQGRYLLEGKNYLGNEIDDESGHGTEVAGIIAAATNNSKGIAGVCGDSNVKVVPYKVLNKDNIGYVSNLVMALKEITKSDAKVVNLSVSLNSHNLAVESALKEAHDAGKIIVASAGNNNVGELQYPAHYNEVISVGAVNTNNQRCTEAEWGSGHGSNFGDGLDYVAPGNNIYSTSSRFGKSTYNSSSGTSFAAPMVTGEIALLESLEPNLSEYRLRSIMDSSSTDLGDPGYDTNYGSGLINIGKAVEELKNPQKAQVYFPVNNLTLYVNEDYRLKYITDLDTNFNWESSNPSVVDVRGGQLRALQFGSAEITLTSPEIDSVRATCHVEVVPAEINIKAHSENEGWLFPVHSLGIAGTTGKNLKLEALLISTDDPNLNIRGRAHIENIGTTEFANENSEIGTTGLNDGLEAIQLELSGSDAHFYQLYYRVHVENYGWTNWATNDQWVGTTNNNLQLEAVEISLQPAGSGKPVGEEANVAWTYNFQ